MNNENKVCPKGDEELAQLVRALRNGDMKIELIPQLVRVEKEQKFPEVETVMESDDELPLPAKTVLSVAAEQGRTDLVRLLLAAGADPEGSTPLHEDVPLFAAARSKNRETLELLLTTDAEVEAIGGRSTTALIEAVKVGWQEGVQRLLAAGADVNAATDNKTPLIVAAGQIRESIVQLMLDHGADVNVVAGGRTALMNALEQNRLAIARLLRRAGAVDIPTQFVWNK